MRSTPTITILDAGQEQLRAEITYGDSVPQIVDLVQVMGAGSDLNKAYTDHPGQVAIYAALHNEVIHQRELAELILDQIEGELYRVFLHQCREEGIPATITDKTIRMRLQSSSQLHDARVTALNLRTQERRFKAIVDAFSHRRDMLISLGAHTRHQEAVQEGMRIVNRALNARLGGAVSGGSHD
jgi:hypothetical protein